MRDLWANLPRSTLRPRQAKHCDHFSVSPKAALIVAGALADRARERFSAPACGVRLTVAEGGLPMADPRACGAPPRKRDRFATSPGQAL